MAARGVASLTRIRALQSGSSSGMELRSSP
jgi:hypothetical protein